MKVTTNIIAVLFVLGLMAGSASAQNRQAASNRSQATLTIQIYIAPVIVSPVSQPEKSFGSSVNYSFPTATARLSVTEKIQPEPVKTTSGTLLNQPVKTITMVAE